ncbi:putative CRAL/TRIO domain-containing protein [Operophtera brumata]|uniref:Putative CRAL/TRIO domain-containing protein n=1 Tax=Operophtera brumata TaxID=104452 RepID=A0A0L7KW07_OPEBR|nr:putative CRAL/TRIO domain-containing protein [Operophtera brumata]
MEVFVKILKQMFSTKIGNRIYVHMTLESLHEHVPKECLPEEFGGYDKSLVTLNDEFTDELSKKENIEYVKEMAKAVVDESLRVGDKISKDDILGISGSFRTISVD